jgi:hypothetical protein
MVPAAPAFFFWFVLTVFVLPATGLGVVAGGLTCLMLRQHWGVKAAAIDAVVASGIMVVSMYVLSAIYDALGTHSTSDLPVALTISTFSVVAKHLVLPALRSSNQ